MLLVAVCSRALGHPYRLASHAQVHECYHLLDVYGSDHCPLGLVIKLQ